jgi:carboxyl-terminal processing protease
MYENNFTLKSRNKNITKYILVAGLAFIFGWQATVMGFLGGQNKIAEQNLLNNGSNQEKNETVDLALFWTVWNRIEGKYVKAEEIDEEEMVYGAIRGLVDSLNDPYSLFMTPKETKEFTASLEGKLEGIGAELSVKDKNLVIVTPLRASPAERAGLLPKDIIYKIDGESASEMSLFEAVMKIRGEKGTTVTLTIIREDIENPFDVSIVRENIDIESVTVEELEDDIVYIGVNQFNDKTNEEFGKAISKLILSEPKGIIIDLRFNGGGYLDIAVELLSYLLPTETEAVIIKERGKEDVTMKTNGKPKLLKTPLVVLVNESSASASEIVAGGIQDHQRGIIMGAQTFGKGNVQEVDTFFDGSSLRMTIAKWYTPQGRSIEEVGITPDILVEITDEDIENEYDSQKESAIEYLKNL